MGAIRFSPTGIARINRMRVHQSKQGAEIGKAIVSWLESKARAKPISKIILNILAIQKNTQQLYESFGYVKVGEGSPDGFDVFLNEKQVKPEHDNQFNKGRYAAEESDT